MYFEVNQRLRGASDSIIKFLRVQGRTMRWDHLSLGCLPCTACGLVLLSVSWVRSGRRLQEMFALPFKDVSSALLPVTQHHSGGIIGVLGWLRCPEPVGSWGPFVCPLPLQFYWLPPKQRGIFSFSFLPPTPKCDSAIILSCVEVTSDLGGLSLSLFAGLTGFMEPTRPHKHLN